MLYVRVILPLAFRVYLVLRADNDKHSHEIGEANLMFTRRGRKAAQEKGKLNALRSTSVASSSGQATSPDLATTGATTTTTTMTPTPNGIISSSPVQPHDPRALSPSTLQQHLHHHHHHPHSNLPPHPNHTIPSSLVAPLPSASAAPPPPQSSDVSQERWDRMAVLFASIRQHARGFEYPTPSVAALESVLIRLYLESPIGSSLGPTIAPSLSTNRWQRSSFFLSPFKDNPLTSDLFSFSFSNIWALYCIVYQSIKLYCTTSLLFSLLLQLLLYWRC